MQPQSPTNTFNVSVAQNPTDGAKALSLSATRLVFPTIKDYRAIIDTPSVVVKNAFMTTVNLFSNFTSWNEKYVNDQSMGGDLFATILNSDGIVQIGDYIIKINVVKDRAFVLPLRLASQYAYLVKEDTINATIKTFSNGIDLLDELENGNFKRLFCGESGAGTDGLRTTEQVKYTIPLAGNTTQTRIFIAGVEYIRRAVYFITVFSGEHNVYDSPNGVSDASLTLYMAVKYKVKCGRTQPIYYPRSTVNQYSKIKYRSYEGSQPLNAYYFSVDMSLNNNRGVNLITTKTAIIRRNY